MTPSLYIVLDDSPGLGHKMRTLAIAEEWLKRGGVVHYNLNGIDSELAVMLFDGYSITSAERQKWRDRGHTTVAIDDLGVETEGVDVIINYQHGATKMAGNYVGRGISYKLLGPFYFPLRHEYAKVKIIDGDEPFDADAANRKLSPSEFARKMGSAKYIMASASVKAYEAAYLGKPLLIRQLADNQKLTYREFITYAWAMPDTQYSREFFDDVMIRKNFICDRGARVDAGGAGRICDVMLKRYGDKND